MKSLHNLSYKTLFTILFLALAGIVFFLKIGGKTQKVSASWWDDSWHYRQAINISSHNSLESNVYITTAINIGTTTKAQTDDGDFRFISQSGENLSYYIVSGAGTTNVSFHILIPSFPSGTSTIYAYYGNSTIQNGFSSADFSTEASNYTIGSLSSEEVGGGPIAYWKFDEGVGTTAYDSSNLNHGVLSGTTLPEWQSEESCISGKCLSFNSTTNYVDTNYDFSYGYDDSVTISVWIKPNSIDTGGKVKNIVSKNNYEYFITQENSYIRFIHWNNVGNNAISMTTPSGSIEANKWQQITYIYNGSTHNAYLYINGVLKAQSGTSYTDFKNTTESIKIGKGYGWSGSTTPLFNGLIDEVKIYNYTRTLNQIKQDYNSRGSLSGSSANLGVQSSTAPDLNSSLFSHWKFNNSLYNSVSTGSTAIAPLSGTPNYTSAGKDKQGLDFTQLYTGNFTYVSSNTFEDTTKNWTTNELVGYQFAADYTPNSQYCQGTITSNTSTTITFSGSCSSWVGNKYYRIKKSIYISAPLTGHSTNAITASLWFKSNGSQGNRIARMSNEAFNFTINGNNISTGINTYGSHITYTTNNVNDQKWHYMAITYDGSTEKLFYDGVAVGLYSTATTVISNGSLTLGSRNDGMQEFFNGSIDEVKIYNKALTPDEIKQDYNGSSAIQFGSTNQTIGGTTTSLDYCIPGDTSYCAPPVAEWKMDEGVGTSIIDTSGNSNTGTFGAGSSAPTWAQGKIGKGLIFNGTSNFINIGNSSPFNNLSTISISLWAKPNSISGCQTLVSKANSAGFGIELGCATSSKWNWSPHINGSYRNAISDNVANTSSWTHIEGIYDGNIVKLYINGSLQSTSVAVNGTITNNAVDVLFGENPPTDGSFFNGTLDQVRIYNYARTPAQVAYDYNRGGPVGWWKMDECQGSTIYDWSGNGNNGTLTIGSSGTQNSIGTCQIGTSAAWTNGATGKFNSSLNFDGIDDTILIGNSTAVQIEQGDFSVSTWLKPSLSKCGMEGIAKSGNIMCGTATAGGWALGSTSDYKFRFRVSDSTNVLYKDVADTNLYSLNIWYHVVGIKKNNTIYLYVNNKLVGSNDITGLTIDTNKNLYIGGRTIGYWLWPGQIDDVRIYNYALTPDQIKQVYNGGAINFN